jgi:hypothetical protein
MAATPLSTIELLSARHDFSREHVPAARVLSFEIPARQSSD